MILDIRGNVQDYLDALGEDEEFLAAFDRVNAAVEFGQRQAWTTHDIARISRELRKFARVRGVLDVRAWCQLAHHRYDHMPAHKPTAEVLSMFHIHNHKEGNRYGDAV